jgi:type IV secretion system protein VirB1
MLPGLENLSCQNMAVPMEVMQHVVGVESSYNPFAIGVVGGRLVRQPQNLPEALATVKMLETRGYNFSLGLAQVNRYNLSKYGLDSYQKAFEACPNLKAGSAILAECYHRLNGDWGKSFSCYYSGNSITGFRHGYVQKIYSSMRKSYVPAQQVPGTAAIPVVGEASRRLVEVKRHPMYTTAATQASESARLPANAPAAIPSRKISLPQRAEQPGGSDTQPLSRMQRIIAAYREADLASSQAPSALPASPVAMPAPAAAQQAVAAANAQDVVARTQALPVPEPPVLLQPTNAPAEAVGAVKKSAFVF